MDRQYIVTERAHLMCPNMNFGILCLINEVYDYHKLKEVIEELQEAHPFLKSLISNDGKGNYYYDLKEGLEIKCEVKNSQESLQDDYRNIANKCWDVHTEGMLKILVYPRNDGFNILFAAHHLLCDGRGLLGLAVEFADCYVKGVKPVYAEESLIKSIDDLPAGSDLPWISKMVVNSANRNWQKEKHQVEYSEYLEFEKKYTKNNKFNLQFAAKSKEELNSILKACHENEISLNDYLIAKIMQEEKTNKVVMAADIRKYLKNYHKGSLGNYSTAFSVVDNSKIDDCISKAKNVAKQVKKHLNSPKKLMLVLACYLRMKPQLIDAVAISTLGDYQSKAGCFVGGNMFGYKDRNGYCITNLGKIDSDTLAEAVFIPPMSPANKMIEGIVTVNGKMNICKITMENNI